METKNQEIIAETLLNPEINLQFPKIHPSNPDQSLIGLRVELNDQIGIVKYVGPVHKEKMKSTDIFLGIEWEDPLKLRMGRTPVSPLTNHVAGPAGGIP